MRIREITMADPENGVMSTETSDDEGGSDDRKELVDKLMKDPQILAALQTKLKRYLGSPSGYIEALPKPIKRRIKALKKLQLTYTDIEVDFFKEVHALEVKYDNIRANLFEKRTAIIAGSYEPNDEESNFTLYEEEEEAQEEEKLCQTLEEKANVDESDKIHNFDDSTKGVPEFWLTIFKNVDLLTEMVQDYDEPILALLQDIKLKFHDDPMGFTLEFHFPENEFFSNTILTKYYEMKCEPDKDDPFCFEGPEIIKCKGCKIQWKKGKNVTQKIVKKKQKHKSKGAIRTITKTVQNDSFFNFFNPPPVPEDSSDEMDEDIQALLTADFEIGHYIRERIIPRAVLYFTGEALDDKDFEEEEEEEDEDEDMEYNSEDDSDFDPEKECKENIQKGGILDLKVHK